MQGKKWLDPKQIAEHGQYIFIYANRKNHVVYSLTRAINNNAARKQLPFFGRHSIPPKIRKDEWRPLATVCFPSGFQGLSAYKQLREFRKRHELEWKREDALDIMDRHFEEIEVIDAQPPESFRTDNQRRRYIAQWHNTTQKANCIADLAAVLEYQAKAAELDAEKDAAEKAKNEAAISKAKARLAEIKQSMKGQVKEDSTDTEWQKYKELRAEKMRLMRGLKKPVPHAALNGEYNLQNDARIPAKRGFFSNRGKAPLPSLSTGSVKIEWANVLDAQFASTWPPSVFHNEIPPRGQRARNTLTTEIQPPHSEQTVPPEQRQQSIVERGGLKESTSQTAQPNDSDFTNHPDYNPNVPDPHLRYSPRRMDRILHRLKHGAY